MDSFKADLRSVLLTVKHGVHIDRINDLYFDLTQERISFDSSKFDSLESFLKSLPDVCNLQRTNYGTLVYGRATASQSAIQKLVRGQIKSKTDSIFSKPIGKSLAQTGRDIAKLYLNHNTFDSKLNRIYERNQNKSSSIVNRSTINRTRSNRMNGKENKKLKENKDRSINKDERSTRKWSKNDGLKSSSGKKRERISSSKTSLDDKSTAKRSSNKKIKHTYNSSILNLNLDVRTEKDMAKDNYKFELEQFVKTHNLEMPIYSTPEPMKIYKNGHKLNAYLSSLRIGDQRFLTYPIYFDCAESAKNSVAKIALDHLKQLMKTQEQQINENIIDDLIKLFDPDMNSVCLPNFLEKKYYQTYKRRLESNWLDIIKSHSMFSVDSFKSRDKIYYTITLKTPSSSSSSTTTTTTTTTTQHNNECKFQKDTKSINNDNQSEKLSPMHGECGPQIEVPLSTTHEEEEPIKKLAKKKNLKVVVLNAENGKLWLRTIENSINLDRLLSEMFDYYVNKRQQDDDRPKKILIDKVYAAVIGGNVFRVKIIDLIDDNEMECLFLDDGVYENVKKDQLFELKDEFIRQLPFQAFEVELDGIDVKDEESNQLMEKYIDYKMKEYDNSICVVAKLISLSPVKVCLYDTTSSERDVNLNQLMANFIKNSLLS